MADDLSSENMLDDLLATKSNDFTNRTTAYHATYPFLLTTRQRGRLQVLPIASSSWETSDEKGET
ncbi:hypothetical protein VKT23_006488 [Stygiomarasmius scandens]|uniref:Uncharacterized protein n=1 Tax=Marasmiellus scandens TaxID=2682957 RepID=A0ABR1JN00_9AGAR